MTKRIIFGIFIAIIVISISVFYFIREHEPIAESLYRAVPLDAAVMIEIKNYDEFHDNLIAGNPLWKEISNFPLFNKLKVQVDFLDSLRKSNGSLNMLLSQKQMVLISGHPTGKDDIQLIYYFRLISDKDFRQLNKQILEFKGIMFEHVTRNYEQAEIHDITFPEHKYTNFSYAHCNGIVMICQSAILLEDAVRQLNSTELISNNIELSETMKTAGKNSLLNIYFNFDQFPKLGMKLIHSKYRKSIDFAKNFGKWIELDLNPKPGTLIFNGFSFANSSNPSIESLFKNQKPVKLDIFNKIPTATNTFAALGISDFDQYIKDYELFQEVHGDIQNYRAKLQALKTDFNIDLIGNLHSVFEHEIGTVFLGETLDSITNQSFTVMQTKGNDEAHKMLYDFITEYGNKTGIKPASLLTNYKNNDLVRKIYSLPFGNIPALVFGNMFSLGDNKVCTVVDNYLIFGNNVDALNKFANAVTENNTLGSDPDFINFSEYFSTQTNFFFYNKPALSGSFYGNFLKKDIIDVLDQQQAHFNRFNTFVYQFNISNNGLIYNNIFIRYSPQSSGLQMDKPEKTKVSNRPANGNMIEIPLDGKPVIKPVFLKNGGELEIFVQDDKNQIYLMDKSGKVLWKVKISDHIISDVVLIDYYKNGKLQLLFNTGKQLILIDRKGKFVEKYPVTLPAVATNGVAVFDYENDRNYRFFIAYNDHSVMALDKDGKPINGWNFGKTESEVSQQMQHFRIEGKDFLTFTDKNKLYVVDRKGNIVINTKTKFKVSGNCKVALINSKSLKEACFALTDMDGKVYLIGMDGTDKMIDFGKFPANHYFDVYDINADGVKEFIFTSGNQLKIVTQNNKLLTTITTQKPISFRPIFYEFATNKFEVGIVTNDDEKIYLYKLDGKIEKGFPLKGTTQFSIKLLSNAENRLNLIVGSNNNFLYSYSVQ